MNNDYVKLSSNWLLKAGCELDEAVQSRIADRDIINKPSLESLIVDDKSVLLCQPDKNIEKCNLIIQIFPKYRIHSFNLVCNVQKLEIFQGPQREYLKIVYGQIAETTEVDDQLGQLVCYRYDIEVNKFNATEIAIALITNTTEVCLFGLCVHLRPTSNDINTLLKPLSEITVPIEDMNMLKSGKQQDPPLPQTKCIGFLSSLMKSKSFAAKSLKDEDGLESPPIDDKFLYTYLDTRFAQIEELIEEKVTNLEKMQNAKLDKILHEIEKLSANIVINKNQSN